MGRQDLIAKKVCATFRAREDPRARSTPCTRSKHKYEAPRDLSCAADASQPGGPSCDSHTWCDDAGSAPVPPRPFRRALGRHAYAEAKREPATMASASRRSVSGMSARGLVTVTNTSRLLPGTVRQ